MDEILEILKKDARVTAQEIAKMIGKSADSVKKAIKKYEDDGTIIQYATIVNQDLAKDNNSFVWALIEVNIAPQKDAGFDDVAERIYSFPEVKSCYLVSGDYDLLVVVEGETLQTVSSFIASKLAPMEHVRGTKTHFMLKKYKESGHVLKKNNNRKKLNISY